ncbi:MAG: hypothetical protein VZQ58_07420 [Bacteroidales bacterium]|nr:hypothetical protein [Bacteroidales bacterium]
MKDEEMAEEIANKRCHEIMCYGHCNFSSPKHHRCGEWHREYNCALEGLKAGRPQWHKVADGNLPKIDNRIVLCVCIGGYINNEPNYVYKLLTSREFCLFQPVIAWCEIPTFDKENE